MYIRKGMFVTFILVLGWVSIPFVHAQTSVNDCNLYGNDTKDGYVQAVQDAIAKKGEELKIFTDKDLKIILQHIQQHCCAIGAVDGDSDVCKEVKKIKPYYYAESTYIVDHIINIGLRKLDGLQEQCDALGIDCDLADGRSAPTQRREQIVEIAESTDGHPAAEVEGYFRQYRGGEIAVIDENNEEILPNIYTRMCDELELIREAVDQNTYPVDATITQAGGPGAACRKKVQERYTQEVAYVRTLMVEKQRQYMVQNLQQYMHDYFLQNRFADLVDKYSLLDACMGAVLRFVERTACCNIGGSQ